MPDEDDKGAFARTFDLRVAATIDGKEPGLQFHSAGISQSLYEPTRLRLELGYTDDRERGKHSDALGKKLALTIQDAMDDKLKQKYSGVITGYSLTDDGIVLEALSADYVLGAGRKHRIFDQMTISDVVKKVVSDRGISVDAVSTSAMFDALQQYGETDQEFLCRLAAYAGCWFYFDQDKFLFLKGFDTRNQVKVDEADLDDIILQCSVEDIQKKRGGYYNAELHNDPGEGVVTSKATDVPAKNWKSIFKGSDSVDEDFDVWFKKRDALDAYLAGRDNETAGGFVRVHGKTNHPMVVLGRTIVSKDSVLGDKMAVISLEATFSGNVYTAEFRAVPNTLALAPEPEIPEKAYLLQPAIVIDSSDPNALGRVRVRFFWNDRDETYWARVVQAGAGGEAHGTHFTPRIGDSVLVGFESGDVSQPVVLGALYHSEMKPKFLTDNGTAEVLVAKTPISTIHILDKQDSEQILLSMKDTKNVIRLELKGPQITIESLDGTITIHSKTVKINADDKIEMNAKEITMSSQQNTTMKVGQDLSVSVTGNSSESVTQEKKITASTNVTISANAEAALKGSVKASVSGAMVESTASATNTIKGGMVMIN